MRVIVPDFGGGFGGKHTADAGVEAARLAKAAGKPVLVRWTRREEFTWAYFRPAAVIDIEAGLDAEGTLTSWFHVNINSGGSAIDTPYRAGKAKTQFVPSDSPAADGSYRALAATANNFARECFMDELAAAAGRDPLEFRLAHLDNPRLRAVLETAAERFDWAGRRRKKDPAVGVGLACGTEKGSYVAACVEIAIEQGEIAVRRVCEVFECGAILNPANLPSQVHGCILMGLGPALREEMQFEKGGILNASFSKYLVPRFRDVPELDIHLLDRPDLPSAGAGETPIMAIAPAIANAVFHATGQRDPPDAHPPAQGREARRGRQVMIRPSSAGEIHRAIVAFADSGKAFAAAVVLKDEGSTPRKAATKALIEPDGSIRGTIGGGKVEAETQRLAVEAIRTGRADGVRLRAGGRRRERRPAPLRRLDADPH